MGYLRTRDYSKQIQSDNLTQIISADTGILTLAELAAQEECISYLVQKYMTDQEFTDTNPWSPLLAYTGGDRFELNYSDYIPATSYAINDLVTQAGKCYVCTATTTGAFDAADWDLLGNKFDLFYGAYPFPIFDITKVYKLGDQVFWKGNTYTCKIATIPIGHGTALQAGTYANLPQPNVFPDDAVSGVQYWGSPVAYTIAAGTFPYDDVYTLGDNRSQQLVMMMIDITLYHVHSRIAPRNIPALRDSRYVAAIEWLNKANTGTITANIPILQPAQGRVIRYGGNTKANNTY